LVDGVWLQIETFYVPLEHEKAPEPLKPTTPKIHGEKNELPTAYILLNTEIGAESQVLKALRNIEGVEEAHNLWGVYDIIANVQADSMEKLKFIITKRIEKIGRINSKLTMIITDHPLPAVHEQVMFEQPPLIM
jgi:DNA-binding Lrp family transcriptional regulator